MICAFLIATFLGVSTIALATCARLRFPRSVALLTAGYSVGQDMAVVRRADPVRTSAAEETAAIGSDHL